MALWEQVLMVFRQINAKTEDATTKPKNMKDTVEAKKRDSVWNYTKQYTEHFRLNKQLHNQKSYIRSCF